MSAVFGFRKLKHVRLSNIAASKAQEKMSFKCFLFNRDKLPRRISDKPDSFKDEVMRAFFLNAREQTETADAR
jgi:hypothetical protein